ncbi:tyrosine-type recombinase/integrase [Cellulosilyticum lentocellum]|uniref:Integrase family protein n=1 Tax=Cellulosilyticum lentocellum (strain ATCC 49066 / DSM 5427 / NCIMB 11756 / RHM5) TaxID=642492 RepID=F2JNB7_CELLD|nr:site-specific integrase [Cellulosilyticum lentocellum]ADZ83571.1 integrase family protein [Cellulosilyticum lentocellum DSM 5427]
MSRVLYSQERWEKVNAVNKELMQLYLRSTRADRRRPNTCSEYTYDLRFFLIWNLLYNNNMNVLEFKKRNFEDFKFFMTDERNVSNARANRLLCVVRRMMDYAEDDDDLYEFYVRNVAAKVKSLEKKPVKENTFLKQEQIDLLRGYLINKKMYQHLCLLDVFYDTGARINEVLQVKNTDTLKHGYIKVECKGGEKQYILIHEHSQESIKLHLSVKESGDAFWQSKYGEVKKTSTLRGWVKDMYEILKEIDPSTPYFTPHSFRHTVIENLCNGTHYLCKKIGRKLTIEEAQIIVHHKSIDMTKSYMKPKDGEIVFKLFGISLG